MSGAALANPFRPGAGHMPPYLAGRHKEIDEFVRLLSQDTILENMVLTGLRGVGKTVLLETFRPRALAEGWGWVGTDLSESTSTTEHRMALRLLTDLAVVTSSIELRSQESSGIGFRPDTEVRTENLTFEAMVQLYERTPGLVADKLKAVLEMVWSYWQGERDRGLIFAYDEAQTLSDHASKDEYPLSLLLDVFVSIQKKGIPFMLILVGLPTLFPKLVEARTFAERMFRVVFLDRLNQEDSRDAIVRPLEDPSCPVKMGGTMIQLVIDHSGGYPYFIQFICREVVDVLLYARNASSEAARVSMSGILRKLDTDFFAGRWARATDRQRELLTVIAHLENSGSEFTVQEVVERSKELLEKPFGSSHVNQMLVALGNAGLVYKNRHGKYSFAVPLLGQFILRQQQ